MFFTQTAFAVILNPSRASFCIEEHNTYALILCQISTINYHPELHIIPQIKRTSGVRCLSTNSWSNCLENWLFSSPQRRSCLLCDHPMRKIHMIRHKTFLYHPYWTFILTVAKVAWNNRFSSLFPSAKVSSNAAVVQKIQSGKAEAHHFPFLLGTFTHLHWRLP